jgi:hypothetical protein
LAEIVFEGVEELKQLIADPLTIASASNSCRYEHAGLLEAVQRPPCRRRRHPVPLGRGFSIHNWLSWQAKDDPACDGARAGLPCSCDQLSEQCIDLGPEPLRRLRRRRGRFCERPDPVVDAALAKIDESGDVPPSVGGHDDADGGDEQRGDPAAAEDDVDQAPTCSPIPVAEGVDGPELGMGNRCLRDGRQIVEVDEADKVIEQFADVVLRRRYESGVGGAQPAPADPVLLVADETGVSLLGCPVEERPMYVQNVVEAEAPPNRSDLDCSFHRPNVAEDRPCCAVGSPGFVGGNGKPLVGCAQSFDERGAESLGAEQGCGDGFKVVAGSDSLEVAERGRSCGDSRSRASCKRLVPSADAVGNEGLIAERLAVPAGAIAAAFPDAVDEFGQRSDPFRNLGSTKGTFGFLSYG